MQGRRRWCSLGSTALDPRQDQRQVARALSRSGIFNCVSCYKCEEVCPAHIPIVSNVIEPLKAKTVQLVPQMARHSFGVRFAPWYFAVRIDPGELILRIQGLRAFAVLPRLVRLLRPKKNQAAAHVVWPQDAGSRRGAPDF